MMSIDSPAVTDGLPAWKEWAQELEELARKSPENQRDISLKSERLRAARVIEILEKHPQGLSAKDPAFKAVVRALSKDR